jgi:hypothetical protein
MQHKITTSHPLLDSKGHLIEAGYDTKHSLIYNRSMIKASPFRIKEWDYYFLGNDEYGIAITIADNSYMGLDAITLFDFKNKSYITKEYMQWFTMGKKKLPSSPLHGDLRYVYKNYQIEVTQRDGLRLIDLRVNQFKDKKDLVGRLIVSNEPEESMVIATPFNNPKYFYYNQKINCFRVEGSISLGHEVIRFQPTSSFGVLDWGRGVWTYKNTWYWGSASGIHEHHSFGFNIGYGFGDTSQASENMVFYKGIAHKLSEVKFNIPMRNDKEDYLSPWTFISDDGRFTMDFTPVLDRSSLTNFGLLYSNQHQVFGYFTGQVILDDGEILHIDKLFGFAEKVANAW